MSTFETSRRSLLAGLAALSLSACQGPVKPAASSSAVLRVGNQKGTTKALMTAAGVLTGVPYPIEWSEFPAAQHLLEGLGAGAVDVGLVGDAPYLFAFANGSDLKVVQAITYGDSSNVAILVPANSPIRTVADLKGKRVASGKISVGQYLLLRALESGGLTIKDIQPVYMAPSDAKAAFSSGNVDAWATWSPFQDTAVLHDQARILITGKGLLASHAYQVATPAAIHDKLAQLRDFLPRIGKAYAWANANPQGYADALTHDTGLPPDVALSMVRAIHPAVAPLNDAILADADDIVKHLSAASDQPIKSRPIAEAFAQEFRS